MKDINLDGYVHGLNLLKKSKKNSELEPIYNKYCEFRISVDKLKIDSTDNVKKLCQHFNKYRSSVAYELEKRKTSGQENLRSSMMEEFFVHLLSDLIKSKFKSPPRNLFIGKGNGYVDLTFSPKNILEFFDNPGQYFHGKDQDFMMGAQFSVELSSNANNHNTKIVIPIVAIECKTYLERNMLDSCSGTATRIKKATPYCLYIIAAEYLKLADAHPELTDIDEIYVFCRENNTDRLNKKKLNVDITLIGEDLVIDIFELVSKHLNKVWWQPENVISSGKVINRP